MPKNHHGCSTSGGKDPSDGEQTPEENQASQNIQNVTATINPFAPLPRNRQPERSGMPLQRPGEMPQVLEWYLGLGKAL